MIGYTKNAGCPNKILKPCRVPKKKRMEFLGTLRFLWVFADLGFCFPRSGSGTLKNFGFLGTLGIFWFFLVFFGHPAREALFREKPARNQYFRGKPCTGSHFSKKNMHETQLFEESPAREALLQRKTRTKPNVSRKTLGSKRFITLFSLKCAQASPIKPKISITCMAPRPQAFRQYFQLEVGTGKPFLTTAPIFT